MKQPFRHISSRSRGALSVLALMAGSLLALSAGVAMAAEEDAAETAAKQINWDDLLPEGWTPPSMSVDHFFNATPAQSAAADVPVVAALDGQRVKLPGYLVPISMDGEKLQEFLMVPYFGACIHVPPPPPNQIVFVQLAEPVVVEDPYGPHWVTGVLSTTLSDTELAEAAYTMSGELVEIFDWEAMFPDQADSD